MGILPMHVNPQLQAFFTGLFRITVGPARSVLFFLPIGVGLVLFMSLSIYFLDGSLRTYFSAVRWINPPPVESSHVGSTPSEPLTGPSNDHPTHSLPPIFPAGSLFTVSTVTHFNDGSTEMALLVRTPAVIRTDIREESIEKKSAPSFTFLGVPYTAGASSPFSFGAPLILLVTAALTLRRMHAQARAEHITLSTFIKKSSANHGWVETVFQRCYLLQAKFQGQLQSPPSWHSWFALLFYSIEGAFLCSASACWVIFLIVSTTILFFCLLFCGVYTLFSVPAGYFYPEYFPGTPESYPSTPGTITAFTVGLFTDLFLLYKVCRKKVKYFSPIFLSKLLQQKSVETFNKLSALGADQYAQAEARLLDDQCAPKKTPQPRLQSRL